MASEKNSRTYWLEVLWRSMLDGNPVLPDQIGRESDVFYLQKIAETLQQYGGMGHVGNVSFENIGSGLSALGRPLVADGSGGAFFVNKSVVVGAEEYAARITQSGNDNPVVSELKDDFGVTLLIARGGTGVYTGTFSGTIMTANRTLIFATCETHATKQMTATINSTSTSQFSLKTADAIAGAFSDTWELSLKVSVF